MAVCACKLYCCIIKDLVPGKDLQQKLQTVLHVNWPFLDYWYFSDWFLNSILVSLNIDLNYNAPVCLQCSCLGFISDSLWWICSVLLVNHGWTLIWAPRTAAIHVNKWWTPANSPHLQRQLDRKKVGTKENTRPGILVVLGAHTVWMRMRGNNSLCGINVVLSVPEWQSSGTRWLVISGVEALTLKYTLQRPNNLTAMDKTVIR